MEETALSLTDRAYNTIREAILSSRVVPGQPLIESQIARELAMSKTPVREALQRLTTENLVVLDRFRGATVRPVSPELIRNVYEVRELLEPLATRQAVPRLTDEAFERLENAVRTAERALAAADVPSLGEANRAFHSVFVEYASNSYLEGILTQIQDQIRVFSVVIWISAETRLRELREHIEIIDAARRRDADLASTLMAEHLATFEADVIRAVESNRGVARSGIIGS